MSQSNIVTANNPADADSAKIIYILYLVGQVIPIIPAIIGLVMAYMNRESAPAWVQSHYQVQIRTFWIGALYFIIGMLLTMFIVSFAGWLVLLLMMIWWIIRCIKGLKAVFEGVPYDNPTTWMW